MWAASCLGCLVSLHHHSLKPSYFPTQPLPQKVLSALSIPLQRSGSSLHQRGQRSRKRPLSAIAPLSPIAAASDASARLPKARVFRGSWLLNEALHSPLPDLPKLALWAAPAAAAEKPPAIVPVVLGDAAVEPTVPRGVSHLIQTVFRWTPGVAQSSKAGASEVSIRTQYLAPGDRPFTPLGQCTLPERKKFSMPFTENLIGGQHRRKEFQVWVRGCLVATFPEMAEAKALGDRLDLFLRNTKLDAAQLVPALVSDRYVGKVGDRVLFEVEPAVAQRLQEDVEVLLIQWVNNLRIALGGTPLSFVEAQQHLYALEETTNKIEGIASWYGPYFHGRLTATGEIFDQSELTAAHPSLPFDTYLKVKNLKNGYSVIVRINDRGPYFENRTLDLSREAARRIDSEKTGVVPIEAVIMRPSGPIQEGQVISGNPGDRRVALNAP